VKRYKTSKHTLRYPLNKTVVATDILQTVVTTDILQTVVATDILQTVVATDILQTVVATDIPQTVVAKNTSPDSDNKFEFESLIEMFKFYCRSFSLFMLQLIRRQLQLNTQTAAKGKLKIIIYM
jgi:hypothetical protein